MRSNERRREAPGVGVGDRKRLQRCKNFLVFFINFLTFSILHERSSSKVKKPNDTGSLEPYRALESPGDEGYGAVGKGERAFIENCVHHFTINFQTKK